ncbi:MAG: hypothetical protein M3R02_15120 [Chloroflexota bacterium]|nr:hypothetical protein [Chloroflexota bacterium]
MPNACRACSHKDRAGIDADLAAGVPNRRIAARVGISEASVRRHKADHLPAAVVKAQAETDVRRAFDLVDQLRLSNQAVRHVLVHAYQRGDLGLILRATDRLDEQSELMGKLTHLIHDQTTINIVMTAEFQAVQVALLDALAPYPEARIAAAERLAALGDGRAG